MDSQKVIDKRETLLHFREHFLKNIVKHIKDDDKNTN